MKQHIKQRRDIKYLDFETNKFKTLEQYTFRGLQPSTVRYYRIDTAPYKNINKVKYCNLGRGNVFKISTTLELGCNIKKADSNILHENFIDVMYLKLEGARYKDLGSDNVFYYKIVTQLNTQQFIKDGETYEQLGEKTYEVLNAKDYYPLQFIRNFKYYNIVNI